MADDQEGDGSPISEFEMVGCGKFGQWTITAWSTPAGWQFELQKAGARPFSDFSFDIQSLAVVEEVLRFIQQTFGRIQYRDEGIEAGRQQHRYFLCPQLAVGSFAGVPVEFCKDGAEDLYILVVASGGGGAFRVVFGGDDLREFVLALRKLQEQL